MKITLTSRTGKQIPKTDTYSYKKSAARNAQKIVASGARKQVFLRDETGSTLLVVK